PLVPEPIELVFTTPPQREFGDLAGNVAFLLARSRRAAPRQIAENLAAGIDVGGARFVREVRAVAGYVNFFLDGEAVAAHVVAAIAAAGDRYGCRQPPT